MLLQTNFTIILSDLKYVVMPTYGAYFKLRQNAVVLITKLLTWRLVDVGFEASFLVLSKNPANNQMYEIYSTVRAEYVSVHSLTEPEVSRT